MKIVNKTIGIVDIITQIKYFHSKKYSFFFLKRYKKLPLIIFINGLYKKAITAINDAR